MKVIIFAAILLLAAGCTNKTCISSHTEQKHRDRWVQMIWTGKTMVPIVHPERDWQEEVCDQWKSK